MFYKYRSVYWILQIHMSVFYSDFEDYAGGGSGGKSNGRSGGGGGDEWGWDESADSVEKKTAPPSTHPAQRDAVTHT